MLTEEEIKAVRDTGRWMETSTWGAGRVNMFGVEMPTIVSPEMVVAQSRGVMFDCVTTELGGEARHRWYPREGGFPKAYEAIQDVAEWLGFDGPESYFQACRDWPNVVIGWLSGDGETDLQEILRGKPCAE